MSTTIRHKLTNLEIDPPQGSWEKIASELDDAASGYQFAAKLNELSITPPATAWTNILAGLEQAVPAEDLSAKLYTAEVTPPAAAWNRIESALDEKVTPQRRRVPSFLRYAAAAVLIGLIAFGTTQLLRNGKETGTATATVDVTGTETRIPVATTDNSNSQEDIVTSPDASTHDEEARNDAALEASKKTYAKLDVPSRKTMNVAAGFDFASLLNDDMQEPGNSGYEEGLISANYDNTTDRYILLMTPDGHFIRMSKKLSDLVCCVSGEEEDVKCRIQVDKWRKQIACSPTPHPGNFMDILSLLGSLQDN